eukprot:2471812-Amphidinium_carterae.1
MGFGGFCRVLGFTSRPHGVRCPQLQEMMLRQIDIPGGSASLVCDDLTEKKNLHTNAVQKLMVLVVGIVFSDI